VITSTSLRGELPTKTDYLLKGGQLHRVG